MKRRGSISMKKCETFIHRIADGGGMMAEKVEGE